MQQKKSPAFHLTEINLQQELPTLRKTLKYQILKSLGPNDFLNIKKLFQYYGKDGVKVQQFVCLMLQILYHSFQYDKYTQQILTLIQLFIYIDYQNKKIIKFEQFTNFVIENQGIFTAEQSLDDFRLAPAKAFKDFEITGQKFFPLNGYEYFGVLDQTQKNLQIIDPKTFKISQNISMGGTIIINVLYIKQQNSFVIATNDKNLNFYNIQDNKLVRRFALTDTPAFLCISQAKNILYSGSSSGKIYEWSLKRIFSQFKSILPLPKQYIDFLHKQQKNNQQQDLTFMLTVQSIQMIITGSNDSFIRLYQIRESGLSLIKTLEGHYKGIKCLSYSQLNKVIVSCSFDFDVLVWNAYLDHPVAKLIGHEAPLNSVYCPQKHSIIISLDSKGIMKIWNCKTFQLIQNLVSNQVFIRTSITFSYKQEEDVAVLCMKKLLFYQFSVSYDPKVTDDKEIVAFKYSEVNLQIYIGTNRNFKVWSVEKGIIVRNFKNVIQNDIINLQLDKNHRRAFVGSVSGSIISLDVFTGIILNKYAEHTKQISYIGYSQEHCLLISGGWDKTIKIHNDTDKLQKIDKRNNVFRIIKNCHEKDLILASYSDNLLLIATSSRDPTIRVWDFQKGHYQCQFIINQQVSFIHFINPFPLLAVSDIKGNVFIFICKYHKKYGKVLISWKNMYSIQKQSQVTYISSQYKNGSTTLILGDEYGYIRLIKLNNILQMQNIVPISMQNTGNKNPFRIQDYVFTGHESSSTTFRCSQSNIILPQKMIRQTLQIKAHNDRVNNVCLVHATQQQCILSVGNDKLVKLWNDKGTFLGSLKQGYTVNDSWKFNKKRGYQTKQQQIYKRILKTLPQIRNIFLNKKRAKMIPFSASNEQDFSKLQQLDSNQIYKDLRQIEDYLRKNNPKSQKRLY